jgi:peptide deformylase
MVRDIVVYPDKRVRIKAADVRRFDEALASVIEDLKDTMKAHNVNAMAATQIAIPMSVLVIQQDDGSYLEVVNPRIIGKKGSVTSTEETLYFPDTPHTVQRYEMIRLVYEDRHGNQKALKAEGDLAITLQRKIDYLFGDTIASRIGEEKRKHLENTLADKGMPGSFEVCPTVFVKDYFTSMIQKVLFFMALTLLTPLFSFAPETVAKIRTFDEYATIAIMLLLFGYFAAGIWEGKKYTSCTSCQIGNMLGTAVKYVLATTVIATAAYFLLS